MWVRQSKCIDKTNKFREDDQVKDDEKGRACSTHGIDETRVKENY